MRLPPKKTLTVFLALCAVGSAACVKQNAPGVGVVKFDSSAVFGISKEEPAPAAPDFSVPGDFSDIPTDLTGPTIAKPPPDLGPCPPAKLTAFPKEPASVQVHGTPPEGVYRWKRDLFVVKDATVNPPLLKQAGFMLDARAIRRVTRDSDHQFNFEMLSDDPFQPGNTIVTGFRVNTNPDLIASRNVGAETVGVVNTPGTAVRVTDPTDAPGIYITRLDSQDSKGTRVSTFHPVQPMLVLPLEGGIVRTGQNFRSIGIDSTSATTIENNGVVGRQTRIDACGEIVEGYSVELHQVLTSDIYTDSDPRVTANRYTRQETREVTYNFATEYGALPIGESLSLGDINVDPKAALGKWELGGLTPTPLPDSAK